MNRVLQSTVIVALVSLCAPALAQSLQGTLYKDQNCPCCEGHARYLMRNGIDVDIKPVEDIAAISKGAGIPRDYQGCHTLMLEGYAIEGHVTIEIIEKLLKERPADVVPCGTFPWAPNILRHVAAGRLEPSVRGADGLRVGLRFGDGTTLARR